MAGLTGIGIIYYFFFKPKQAANTVASTGTAGTIASIFAGWTGFTKASQKAQTDNVSQTFSLLQSVTNLFSSAPTTKSPGVSQSGSNWGGVSTAGAGAGVPVPANPVNPFDSGDYFSDLYTGPLSVSDASVN